MAGELFIYDEIGPFGITAKEGVDFLAANPGDVVVRINSPGGCVFEGLALYNALKQHDGNVRVLIDGLAASAASFIAMAGDTVEMHEGSFMMIHRAFGMGIGNSEDFDELAGMLRKIDASIVKTYANKTGIENAVINKFMSDETWFDSDEAEEKRFVDKVIKMKANSQIMNAECLERFNYKNVPTALFGHKSGANGTTTVPEAVLNMRSLSRNRKLNLKKKLV